MKSLERLLLFSILATGVVASACESVHVPEWPYALAAQDAGASDDGASVDATGGPQSASSSAPSSSDPLACDGALCDTTNYSYTGCNVAGAPAESRAVLPISGLLAFALTGVARRRTRRPERAS